MFAYFIHEFVCLIHIYGAEIINYARIGHLLFTPFFFKLVLSTLSASAGSPFYVFIRASPEMFFFILFSNCYSLVALKCFQTHSHFINLTTDKMRNKTDKDYYSAKELFEV